ncbi:hypothetical protein SDC9_143525 [bioreactor metagenome]|uniref:DUF402 domain-containing protein n=1 Tax=bioreactor metagenome TaxID=1076179 RepID=A0A645E3J4_9ZZZZ|nr:DUF402 domain-containing protein [Oscillospiraceae bacterium]
MKRKRLDRDIWTSITSKRYIQKQIKNSDFNGIVSLLYIDDVSTASRWKYPDKEITVCDKGMKWLQIMPFDEYYVITAMINDQSNINIWYIDMIANKGFSEDNVAFFDDLYLDLTVRPNGDIDIDDMDELEDALKQNDITDDLFNLALSTKEKLQKGILTDIPKFNDFCIKLMLDIENINLL